jgi:hypothetical protein
VSTTIVLAALLFAPASRHWFVLPILCCGILAGVDGSRWLRGRLGAFDPIALLGVYGYHFFFLAPLFHVIFDFWLPGVSAPEDWRDWIGRMAVLNLVGLIIYLATRRVYWRPHRRSAWTVDPGRYRWATVILVSVAFAAQFYVFNRFGGITGYVRAHSSGDLSGFRGLGPVLLVGESLPILLLMAAVLFMRARRMPASWWRIGAILACFVALQFLVGGLRGSRSNTVWAVFWAVGIIHLWLRPLSRYVLLTSVAVLIAFMGAYSFYKFYGVRGVELLKQGAAAEDLKTYSGRPLLGILLWDMSRSDVQAYMLYRLTDYPSAYENAFGRTYVGALALVVPRQVWPDRPPTKVSEGTELLHGSGTYEEGTFQSARVYGLAGEAMLNFGPLGVPIAFAFLGVVMGYFGRLFGRLHRSDPRLLWQPLVVILCIALLSADSDNVVFLVLKNGTIPFTFVFLLSERRRGVVGRVPSNRYYASPVRAR